MHFVKFSLDVNYNNYSYKGASNTKMGILGLFLIDDVGCSSIGTYLDWALNDPLDMTIRGNCTYLEKSKDLVVLRDLYSELQKPTQVKITCQQFVQLLDDWQEKVCKRKPKEVTITYDGNQFTIETSDV
jgi:hypothetical protein